MFFGADHTSRNGQGGTAHGLYLSNLTPAILLIVILVVGSGNRVRYKDERRSKWREFRSNTHVTRKPDEDEDDDENGATRTGRDGWETDLRFQRPTRWILRLIS
jgi:hypothetical protein